MVYELWKRINTFTLVVQESCFFDRNNYVQELDICHRIT